MRAFRLKQSPFEAGDDDLLQVIADRVGAVVGENRVRSLLQRQLDRGATLAERVRQLTSDQRELLEQLSQVEERERLLLAEALHDDPMQLVIAATMRLETIAARPDAPSDDLDKLIEILEEAIGKLRTLIIALTPPELEDGLGMALRRLTEAVFVLDESVRIEVTGMDHVSLSQNRKMNACRILREGLVNARKHAHATHIWLNLQERDGVVTVILSDNGQGAANLDAGPGHLGMATMRGRAAAEGGVLDITTAPGEGTTLTLTLPVDAPSVNHPDRI